MAVKTAPASDFRLVGRFPLASIRDDAHLREAVAMLNQVLTARKDRGAELYLDALVDLVETYERAHEPLGDVSEADVLRELMRLHGLTQEGLEAAVGIAQSTDLGRAQRQALADEGPDDRAGRSRSRIVGSSMRPRQRLKVPSVASSRARAMPP
jgi:antitoxin component HigA of HigAB toxin-antitoxin module